MKRLGSLILLKICLVSLLLAAPAGAAISPYNELTGNVTFTDGYYWVHLTVFDPQFNLHVRIHYRATLFSDVVNFNISNGIARWVEKAALPHFKYAIYDPERGFKFGESYWFTDIVEDSLQESNGVVCGWGQDWAVDNFPEKIYLFSYSTYDPILGRWVEGNSSKYQSICPDHILVNKDGIVAFYYEVVAPFPGNAVLAYIYDYTQHSWQEGIINLPPAFSIDQLSIKFVIGMDTVYWGYNPSEGGFWQQGHTRQKSFFRAFPNSGKKPLLVSFWDLSVGSLQTDWTFGDGGSATQGSLYYWYNTGGIYVAYQNVIGNYGSDWTKTNIYVAGGGMPPFLPLLLLD